MPKTLLTLMLGFLFIGLAFGDTIILKNGRKIEGDIVEKTNDYIQLELYGAKIKYLTSDIDSLIESSAAPQTAKEQTKNYGIGFNDNLFLDDQFGFSVITPRWLEIQANPRQIEFRKEAAMEKEIFAERFLISIDKVSGFKGVNSAFSYAKNIENEVKTKMKSRARIIEPVKSEKVGDFDSATFTYGIIGYDKKGNSIYITTHYFYYLGDDIVVLMYMAGNKDFSKNEASMLRYLRSFQRLSDEDRQGYLAGLIKKEIKFKPVGLEAYSGLSKGILEVMNKKHTYKSFMRIKDPANAQLSRYDYIGFDFSMTFVDDKNFEIAQYNYYANGAADIWRVVGEDMYVNIGYWMPSPTDKTTDKNFSVNAEAMKESLKRRKEVYSDYSYNNYLPLIEKQSPQGICDNIENFIILRFVPEKLDFLKDYMFPAKTITEKEVVLWINKKDNTIRFAKTIVKGADNDAKPVQREIQNYFNNFDAPFTLGVPVGVSEMMRPASSKKPQ